MFDIYTRAFEAELWGKIFEVNTKCCGKVIDIAEDTEEPFGVCGVCGKTFDYPDFAPRMTTDIRAAWNALTQNGSGFKIEKFSDMVMVYIKPEPEAVYASALPTLAICGALGIFYEIELPWMKPTR